MFWEKTCQGKGETIFIPWWRKKHYQPRHTEGQTLCIINNLLEKRTLLHYGIVEYSSGCVQIDYAGCASCVLAQMKRFDPKKKNEVYTFCMFSLNTNTHLKLWYLVYGL
ncbi:hypothetical protein XENOCAPTIV_015378 [Xenoophorus captivus]|uniref:Uncharacterized protein n=1 Tax=Xenoophorus captivus TaxID=1517983 RepID=A0ABV0SFG9_9TELE